MSEAEDATLALFALTVADRPRFTEQDEELERSTMTDEERVAALCDLLGQNSLAGTHTNKKARRDLERESLDFLISQMRLEIERIPIKKKQALTIAQQKCRTDEFSDECLERFLRCEGMNTKVSDDMCEILYLDRRGSYRP